MRHVVCSILRKLHDLVVASGVAYQGDLLAAELSLQCFHLLNHAQDFLQRGLQCRAAAGSLLDTDLQGQAQHSKLELKLIAQSQQLHAGFTFRAGQAGRQLTQ